MISKLKKKKQQCHLVGGFNPFEKYSSNWTISLGRDENKKYLKPPPSHCLIFATSLKPPHVFSRWNRSGAHVSLPGAPVFVPPGHHRSGWKTETNCWWTKSCTSWGWSFIPLFSRFYTSQVVVWDFWTINSIGPKSRTSTWIWVVHVRVFVTIAQLTPNQPMVKLVKIGYTTRLYMYIYRVFSKLLQSKKVPTDP